MKTLDSKADIAELVQAFYGKIRQDELLAPIFNAHIQEDHWPQHLSKLTDFWEANLFGVRSYIGSPTTKHINVDRTMNYKIDQLHFGRWLELWLVTIDEMFEGELALKAKMSAQKMATGQFITMWRSRPKNKD